MTTHFQRALILYRPRHFINHYLLTYLLTYILSKSTHAFLSNLAHRQTDRKTDKHGRKHIHPPLSEVNKAELAATVQSKNDAVLLRVTFQPEP